MIKVNCAVIDDDAAYEEFVAKCQDNDMYQYIKRQCEMYGYDRVTNLLYVNKKGQVRDFNISSSDPYLPEIRWDNATQKHSFSTSGMNLTADEFKELCYKYKLASQLIDTLDKLDLNELYHI